MKNPLWLYEESVMALGGVRHGSGRNPSWLWEESVTCGDWLLLILAISQPDGFLAEPWQTLGYLICIWTCRGKAGVPLDLNIHDLNIATKIMLKKRLPPPAARQRGGARKQGTRWPRMGGINSSLEAKASSVSVHHQ